MIKDILACGPEIKTAYEGQPNTNAFTDAERAKLAGLNNSSVTTVFGRTGAVVATAGDYTTDQVTEGTNQYFTTDRALATTLAGLNTAPGVVADTDSILSAIGKVVGNIAALISGVSSVFGRSGAVTAQNGDYTAAQVTNVPAGAIAAVTVQGALNELDSEKYAASNPAGYVNAATAAAAAPVQSVNGETGDVILSASDVGAPAGSGTSTGTNTGDQTITLTGEASGSGTGSFDVTLSNAGVIGKVLTGFASAAGVVAATDTILQAINKIVGNIAAIPAAKIVQVTNFQTNAQTTTASAPTFTGGNVAPTISQGTEVMTVNHTPLSATNILDIEVQVSLAHSDGFAGGIFALFQGGVTNCLQAANWYATLASVFPYTMRFSMVAGTTGAITFSVRAAPASAGKTMGFNKPSASQLFNGTVISSIRITERTP